MTKKKEPKSTAGAKRQPSRTAKASISQMSMFTPESNWRPPSMVALPSWDGAKRVAIDVETRDDKLTTLGIGVRRGAYVVGYSFTIEGGPSFYLPVRHEGGDNLDEAAVVAYLREQCSSFRGDVVGANLSYDLDYFWENNIHFHHDARYRDIQIADPLIYELHMSYSLDRIASRYGVGQKNEGILEQAAKAFGLDPKKDLWKLPARFVGAYAEQDTALPLLVLREQEKKIDEQGLHDIWNLESRVLPILIKLRRRGVLINQDKLAQISDWTVAQEEQALELVRKETGLSVKNLNKTDELTPVLAALGISPGTTAKGADSVDAALLKSIDHPVGKALLHARKVNKLRTTFVKSIERYMVNGRIHCTFNQIARETEKGEMQGARFGRLSAVDPNMQQQPARDEFAKMWRSIYIPEEGMTWGCLDYSQQEPRWTTHWAASSPIVSKDIAAQAAQAYWDDPNLDNHQFMADLTGLPRKFAKNLYLGLCYGEGGYKLCEDLGLPTRWAVTGVERGKTVFFDDKWDAMAYKSSLDVRSSRYIRTFPTAGDEGQAIMDQFDTRAPFIRQLASLCSRVATLRGSIRTAGGRVLHFPLDDRGNYEWTHKALNRLIQGSSADQMKTAMVAIDEQMPDTLIQLQVHDELDGSFKDRKEAEQVAELMRNAIPGTKVPFRVDVEMGPSWGEAQ